MTIAKQAALTLVAVSGLLRGETTEAADRSRMENTVRQYILDHPEVIVEALKNFQARQQEAEQARGRQAVIDERASLFEDATSPESGKKGGIPVVVFFDYRCGYCKKVDSMVMKLIESNPDVRLIFKELPILGPDSMLASKVALAARKQGAYVEFHKALFAAAEPITPILVEKIAADLKLDADKLRTDVSSPDIDKIITRNSELANKLGVRATPTFVVGSEMVPGALDAEALERLIVKARAAGQAVAANANTDNPR